MLRDLHSPAHLPWFSGHEHRLWNQTVWVQVPGLPLTSPVTWGSLLNPSGPPLSPVFGDHSRTHLRALLEELNVLICAQHSICHPISPKSVLAPFENPHPLPFQNWASDLLLKAFLDCSLLCCLLHSCTVPCHVGSLLPSWT